MMRVTYIILQISTDGETVVACLYVPHKHVLLSLFLRKSELQLPTDYNITITTTTTTTFTTTQSQQLQPRRFAIVPVPGLLTLWTAATIERPERVVARRVTRPVGMAGDGMKASALSRERRKGPFQTTV
jgi:hypothetical protein